MFFRHEFSLVSKSLLQHLVCRLLEYCSEPGLMSCRRSQFRDRKQSIEINGSGSKSRSGVFKLVVLSGSPLERCSIKDADLVAQSIKNVYLVLFQEATHVH